VAETAGGAGRGQRDESTHPVSSHFPALSAGFCELTEPDVSKAQVRDEDPWDVTVPPRSARLSRGSHNAPMLMGRKPDYLTGFRPINIRVRTEG
jgi:hypothetical protein